MPPPVHNPVIPVNNRVEKHVDNSPLINRGQGVAVGVWITNTIIKLILQSFPRLLIEKRYKLINFARVYIILWITRLLRLKSTGRCYDCLWFYKHSDYNISRNELPLTTHLQKRSFLKILVTFLSVHI